MSEKLKPCPFCGKESVYVDHEDGCAVSDVSKFASCGSSSCMPTQAFVTVHTWNTRPIEDALHAEIDRMTAELAALKEANRWRGDNDSRPGMDSVYRGSSIDVEMLEYDSGDVFTGYFELDSGKTFDKATGHFRNIAGWRPLPNTLEARNE